MARHDYNYNSPASVQARQARIEQEAIKNGCPEDRASEFTISYQVEALVNGHSVDDSLLCTSGSFCVTALDKGIPASKINGFETIKEMDIFMEAYSAGINSINYSAPDMAGQTDTAVDAL